MDFFSWDDEWGDAQAVEPEPAANFGFEQPETQPKFEETQPVVEAAPVTHVEQSTSQDWYADEWGGIGSSYAQPEPEPVVQQPVREVVPEPAPEPEPVAPPRAAVAPPTKRNATTKRAVAPQPQTNSWSKEPSTSLFTTPTPNKAKQSKQKKQPQKQKQKRPEEKKRPPMTKAVAKQPAKQVVQAVSKDTSAVATENVSLRKEVADLKGQLEAMNTRLMHLEHSKHLLYNSVCTLNSSGHTYEDRVCWTGEYGGDILPAQRIAYELTEDGTGVKIMMDGLYEVSFNTYGSEPKIQINNETYATGHTKNSSCYLSICVYVAEQPVITCHVENPVKGNACDHWLSIRRFPS